MAPSPVSPHRTARRLLPRTPRTVRRLFPQPLRARRLLRHGTRAAASLTNAQSRRRRRPDAPVVLPACRSAGSGRLAYPFVPSAPLRGGLGEPAVLVVAALVERVAATWVRRARGGGAATTLVVVALVARGRGGGLVWRVPVGGGGPSAPSGWVLPAERVSSFGSCAPAARAPGASSLSCPLLLSAGRRSSRRLLVPWRAARRLDKGFVLLSGCRRRRGRWTGRLPRRCGVTPTRCSACPGIPPTRRSSPPTASSHSSNPDKNASNPEASELFKEVAYSYSILSDPEKRR